MGTSSPSTPLVTPATFTEAMNSPDRELWWSAYRDEIENLRRNATFELVDLPPGKRALGLKWVNKVKLLGDGSFDKCKARIVVQGFMQHDGEYGETYVLVAWYENLHVLLALATAHDYNVKVMDVEGAFLHVNLLKEVYVKQPKGFEDHERPEKVWRLLKSLYGLKQAPFEWNQAIDSHLWASGFELMEPDPCIYIKRVGEQVVYIVLYVYDCTIIGHSDLITDAKQTLRTKFMMKDLKEAKSLLRAKILHDRVNRTIALWQWGHIEGILQDFGMENCMKAVTLIVPGQQLPKLEGTLDEALNLPYQSIVGKLAFLSHTHDLTSPSPSTLCCNIFSLDLSTVWVGP